MNIWQVKAGDGERDYSKVFLQYGVMLMGSGEKGDYRKHKHEYDHREYRYFAEEAVKGDLVVLKRPFGGTKWAARAIGRITSGYSFQDAFSDVEGFSLQHCRQVEWREPSQEKPVPGLGRSGGTISHLNDERARGKAEQLWREGRRKKSEPIPHEKPEELSLKKLCDLLTAEGLPGERAKRITDEIERLQKLADWYYDVGYYDDVSEHEARTFLVVPLIESLGWDKKQVRIEWEHRDVVLFDSPYSQKRKNKLLVLIESKRLGHGLGDAPEQAVKYAKVNPTCDRLVVTDGIRYKLFTKPTPFGGWNFSHYLNVWTPTRDHPYDPDVAGAVCFLLKMLPKGAI